MPHRENGADALTALKISAAGAASSFFGAMMDSQLWMLLSFFVAAVAGVYSLFTKYREEKRSKQKHRWECQKHKHDLELIEQRKRQSAELHERRMVKLRQGEIESLDELDAQWHALGIDSDLQELV